MAEAHQAVAFSFSVSDSGLNVNVNSKALSAVFHSGLTYWEQWYINIKNKYYNGLYPSKPGTAINLSFFFLVISLLGFDLSLGLIDLLKRFLLRNMYFLGDNQSFLMACFLFAIILFIVIVLSRRFFLMIILGYTGWMYEVRGPLSIRTKLWSVLVKILGGPDPNLYSYQYALPKLPLPSVADTIKRYLQSVRPLMNDEEYKHKETLARVFLESESRRLQFYLWLKTLWAPNYVSDWWEEFVYRSGRSPIMVNSNFYAMDVVNESPTQVQAARAANITFSMLKYMKKIELETLKPLMLNKMVPLCSSQYVHQFCSTRIPGKHKDTLFHKASSSHIVVHSKGQWYSFKIKFQNELFLSPVDLEEIYQSIINDDPEVDEVSRKIAALSAGERAHWAEARRRFFDSGCNKASLHEIEAAAFCVILDDAVHGENICDAENASAMAKALLHGNLYDRWFDKSFNLIVFKNGKMGMNVEHSWADAPISGQLMEYICYKDYYNIKYGYKSNGHCKGSRGSFLAKFKKLEWDISDGLKDSIVKSCSVARALADDVDLSLFAFTNYGKGFIKGCRVSPDAFIQCALQLARYRVHGTFCLTYEASMTRLFRDGRTETVRSCTLEKCAFVRAMCSTDCSKEELKKLLLIACDHHQLLYRDAMSGRGVDRHLFCLYVMSKYLNAESTFLREVLMEPWRLSTSQTPQNQIEKLTKINDGLLKSPGGGFGPVSDDGYGVSYNIVGEDLIYFHVSSKRSCPTSNSAKFGMEITQALEDIKNVYA